MKNVSNLPKRPDLFAHTLNNKWIQDKVSHILRHSIRQSAFWKRKWSHLWGWSENLCVKYYYLLRFWCVHLQKNCSTRVHVAQYFMRGACICENPEITNICTHSQILFFIHGSFTGKYVSSSVCGSWSRYSNHTMSTALTIKESCDMSVVCRNVDGQHLFWRLGCCHRRQLWIS